jgi:hypothetical protein
MKLAIIAILVFFVSATLHAEPVWLYGFTCEGGDTYDPSSTVSKQRMLIINGLQKPVRAVALHFLAVAKPLPG